MCKGQKHKYIYMPYNPKRVSIFVTQFRETCPTQRPLPDGILKLVSTTLSLLNNLSVFCYLAHIPNLPVALSLTFCCLMHISYWISIVMFIIVRHNCGILVYVNYEAVSGHVRNGHSLSLHSTNCSDYHYWLYCLFFVYF